MHTKTKGTIAELKIASRLLEDGWKVLFPLGENNRYDLVVEKGGKFVRIQVKYVTQKKGSLDVNCSSSNNWSVLPYNSNEIDYIAVFNASNEEMYFLPISLMTKYKFKLRIDKTKNNQNKGIHYATDFKSLKI